MEKVDFKRTMPLLYAPKNTSSWELIDVPEMNFLMIDGQGNPNTSKDFADAIEALYPVSYTLKFMSKRILSKDYIVSALEGLWYADNMKVFEAADKDSYKWTLMVMQPEWITDAMVMDAIDQVKAKKNPAAIDKVYFKIYREGRSLQLLHVGSFNDEAPKLNDLHHTYMPEHGYTFNGHHHEIYLSDMRNVAPDKLRTILRQPVK
ncbi:MAG: GyrI-like domain-containing protein [Candidatus Saccharimonas sp.]